MMPVYDCGDPDCSECKATFGPNRERAIANYHAREKAYSALANIYSQPLPAPPKGGK